MKVLSLFDGMACGMLAMLEQGIEVERYVAYEIDKYAIKTASHNFPMIEQRGDVFNADFTEFKGFDYVVGGSPCTYWSIAQNNNRETEASGQGWELFSQYVRAIKEVEPQYFIYENNKSMSNAIRESITETFGFEPICINSALLSAQNRQRLYWVGKRNADGTYSKVEVEQPEDEGILLKDILEDGIVEKDKAYCLKHQAGNARDYFKKHHTQIKFEPVATRIPEYGNSDKARPLNAYYSNNCGGFEHRMFSKNPNKQQVDMIAEPVDSLKAVRVGSMPGSNGEPSKSQSAQIYSVDGKSTTQCANGGGLGAKTGLYAIPVESKTLEKAIPDIVDKFGYLPEMFNAYNRAEIKDKAPTLSTGSMVTSSCAVNRFEEICCFAVPCEWNEDGKPLKAISFADGKTYQVYEVKNGFITIKDKQYQIKLADGFYIIRKLTVRECMRLQTVPEWYEFPVSDTQAYKMLGNGWTVAVISYLLNHTKGRN